MLNRPAYLMLLSCYCNTLDNAYVLNIVTDEFQERTLCSFPCVAIPLLG